MPPGIKELDGLPAGEIYLAISNSETKTVGLMEQRLKEYRVAIEGRLDHQDEKLETMQQDLTALVGTELVPGLVSQNTKLLEGLVDRHQQWHDDDLTFRSSITLSVSQLTDKHESIAKDVKAIKWIVSTLSAMRKVGRGAGKAVKGIGNAWKVPTLLITIWIAVIQALHVIMPIIRAYFRQMKP